MTNLGKEGEDDFNFDEWITKNELESVKELLIEHGATCPQTLSLNSTEFQSFMSDPKLLTKSYMIPKIMGAVIVFICIHNYCVENVSIDKICNLSIDTIL